MKFIKWKPLMLTSLVCLLPIFLGVAVWQSLPDAVAIHFNIHGEADNFAPKAFAVFGLPCMMAFFQMFGCVVSDLQAAKHGTSRKFERVAKWMIPCVTVILYILTILYSLGWKLDMRKPVMLMVGIMFILLGNYLPKLRYVRNYKITGEKARKINRFIGFESVILGVLFILSVFLPPAFSVGSILLLIPYIILGIWYSEKIRRDER